MRKEDLIEVSYKNIFYPLLTSFEGKWGPEAAHQRMIGFMKTVERLPFLKEALSRLVDCQYPALESESLGMRVKHPIALAAGFDKNGVAIDTCGIIFSVVTPGSFTKLAFAGNQPQRIFRLKEDRGLINRMSFPGERTTKGKERLS